MKRFGLIGVGGYIAERHLEAIRDSGSHLVGCTDITDSVGIMDKYFPDAEFFTDFERFSEFVADQAIGGAPLDFITICSPNYLHVSHIKFALKHGVNVICEKPLVLTLQELAEIRQYEELYQVRVFSILQLRLHPEIQKLQRLVSNGSTDKKYDVDLTYLTSRGKWYMQSWKGSDALSGGVATNIGIHFFDMLQHIFGKTLKSQVHFRNPKTSCGFLELELARVRWFLSIDPEYLPTNAVKGEKTTYRSITVNGEELEFSGGFDGLHTESYLRILSGGGFGCDDSEGSIALVSSARLDSLEARPVEVHPLFAEIQGS